MSQGFQLSAGEEMETTFSVRTPSNFPGGEYWALVKVMYFGRIVYTDAMRLILNPGAEERLCGPEPGAP